MLMLVSGSVFGQQELSTHFMTNLPQAQQTNPAFMLEEKVSIGLPSLYMNYSNTGFSWKDGFRQGDDGSMLFDLQPIVSELGDHEVLQTQVQADWFRFSFGTENLRFNAYAATKASAFVRYPRQLMELIWEGNEQFIGETVNVGPDFEALGYHEFAVGGAYKFEKIQLGINLKYLKGIANVSSATHLAELSTGTADENYALGIETSYMIQTAGVANSFPNIFGEGNTGLAVDVGMVYHINDKFQVALSATDLGAISWDSNLKHFSSQGSYSFDGIDIWDNLFDSTVTITEAIDSLGESLNFETTNDGLYRSSLPTKVYMSGTFRPMEGLRVNALAYGEFYRGTFVPALALNASKDFGKVFTGGVTYSVRNRSWGNVGIQGVLNLGPLRMFVMSDNIIGLVGFKGAKNASFRWGMNFQF